MSLTAGEIIDGKYRILRMLGQGGMGAVYQGENVRIRRRVAIKVLHASFSSQADSVARFEREAQAAARIGSDHICEVLDLGVLQDGTRYMVMEYLDGETLGARIKRAGRMGPELTIPMMSQVLDALGDAHTAGIIHRDLKPDNIFILPTKAGVTDFVKILDFGVSKFSPLAGSGDEMNLTRTQAVVGTPYYMSPEQARGGRAVDHRSDVYALGVLLYQATTGQVPFQATTFNELLFKIALEPAPPPQHFVPDLDPDFAGIIQTAMAREPVHRFQTCADFKAALLNFQATRGGPQWRPGPGPGQRQSPPTQVLEAFPTPAPQAAPLGLSGAHAQLGASHANAAQLTGSGAHPSAAPLTTSGSLWANAAGAPQPQTANSWGDASDMTRPPARPASKAPLIAAIAAAVMLLGGGAAAWMMLGRGGLPQGSAGPAAGETSKPVEAPPPEPTAAPDEAPEELALPDEPTPPEDPALPEEPAVPDEPAAPTAKPPVTAARPFPAAPRPPSTARPPATAKPVTTTKPGVPGDFGY